MQKVSTATGQDAKIILSSTILPGQPRAHKAGRRRKAASTRSCGKKGLPDVTDQVDIDADNPKAAVDLNDRSTLDIHTRVHSVQ